MLISSGNPNWEKNQWNNSIVLYKNYCQMEEHNLILNELLT